jgi:hypothetical protein
MSSMSSSTLNATTDKELQNSTYEVRNIHIKLTLEKKFYINK